MNIFFFWWGWGEGNRTVYVITLTTTIDNTFYKMHTVFILYKPGVHLHITSTNIR